MTMSKDRLEMIEEWNKQQQEVEVEVPAFAREVKGYLVVSRFDGWRCGVQFKQGKATVKYSDLPRLRQAIPLLVVNERDEK